MLRYPASTHTSNQDKPVSTLALQTAPGNREVDEGNTRTQVWGEVYARITCRQEDVEGGREVDICVPNCDQDSTWGKRLLKSGTQGCKWVVEHHGKAKFGEDHLRSPKIS